MAKSQKEAKKGNDFHYISYKGKEMAQGLNEDKMAIHKGDKKNVIVLAQGMEDIEIKSCVGVPF